MTKNALMENDRRTEERAWNESARLSVFRSHHQHPSSAGRRDSRFRCSSFLIKRPIVLRLEATTKFACELLDKKRDASPRRQVLIKLPKSDRGNCEEHQSRSIDHKQRNRDSECNAMGVCCRLAE